MSGAPETIRASLRGDLDRIAPRALEKAPEARYHSAAGLVEEIERTLDRL